MLQTVRHRRARRGSERRAKGLNAPRRPIKRLSPPEYDTLAKPSLCFGVVAFRDVNMRTKSPHTMATSVLGREKRRGVT